ncbi:MAG TPA: hypothetical protein DEO98_07165 [Legionellales bacterium]|nr:hypothetical protein [Legionellales bacterium]
MIDKITAEEDISSLLVALATGSGKTYVQALWMLVLSLAGHHGIFALPDKLVTQMHKDLRRVLPDTLVDNLLVLREREENADVQEALNTLSSPENQPKIIIASSERLLDKHYQQLLETAPERVFLSFDEQHLLMKTERWRVRLIELSKKMLSMFLTATPSQETYQLSGNKPVAMMSSGQKQAAGQGQFPVLLSENASNMSDRNKLRHYYFWTGAFWQNMFNGILLRFLNAIEQEQSSAAVSIVENLPFYLYHKPDEETIRWRMQVPMARKMLCIVDDNETLVNLHHALAHSDDNDRNIYHNGNLVDRQAITNFFQLPDVDADIVSEDLTYRQEQYKQKLHDDERAIGEKLVDRSLKAQIHDNIFHNMMEYVLTDLTGLDEIEHNRLRKCDPEAFQALIREKFEFRDVAHYQRKLETLIDAEGAWKIAQILQKMYEQLGNMRDNTFESHIIDSAECFNRFVDNWALDSDMIAAMKHDDYDILNNAFNEYANRHLILSVMTGMQTSETPIDDSRPFLGLHEERYPMYEDGVLREQTKRRQRTSLETLDDASQESSFTPNYPYYFDEEISDNYFRLGFVGIYASNKKTEGFSDRNLHTVINLAEHTLSKTNSPDTLIQGIGRNRGLDDTIVPAYIHALGRRQKTLFNLKHLQSKDYYPALFKAQKAYNKQFIAVLGQNVGEEIVHWFRANVDKDETIDSHKLKKQTLKIIARSLRQLNNHNHHNMRLSRVQLTKVIDAAMKNLDKEIARIKKPYKLTLFIKILGSVLNFICKIYFNAKKIRPALKQLKHAWLGVKTPLDINAASTKHPDDVYMKIIKKSDFKTLIANASVAREFKDWMTRKSVGLETTVQKDAEFYLEKNQQDILNEYKKTFIGPLLSKFVVPEKRETLLEAITIMPNLMNFIAKHKGAFTAIGQNNAPENQLTNILAILQKIPGCETFEQADMLDYAAQLNADWPNCEYGIADSWEISIKNYLASDDFIAFIEKFFNTADHAKLKDFLQDENKLTNIAAKIRFEDFVNIDRESLLDLFRKEDDLKDIQTLDERQQTFTEFMNQINSEGLACMDRAKLSILVAEKLTTVFFHAEFYASLKKLIGFLNQDDLTVLFEAMGEKRPKDQAVHMMDFMKIIKRQDKQALHEQFMSFPAEGEISFEALPIIKTIDLLSDLIKEVIDCQCGYHQHDNKGEQTEAIRSKLYDKLSPALQDIRVDSNPSFLSTFSRKIFFIQGIRDGLPRCAKVSAASNQSQIKILKRVKAHILRPLWWGTNMSNIGFRVIKIGRNTAFALKACGFAILNGVKAILNLGSKRFVISARNAISQDYNDTTFDTAQKINELMPFDSNKVAAPDCQMDAVTELETFIKAHPGIRFFPPSAADSNIDPKKVPEFSR